MDEYIKRSEAIKAIENDLPDVVYYRKEDAIACLECLPTADVVPKSEVDKIFEEIEFEIANLDFDRDETRMIAIDGIIANTKKKYTEGKDG